MKCLQTHQFTSHVSLERGLSVVVELKEVRYVVTEGYLTGETPESIS